MERQTVLLYFFLIYILPTSLGQERITSIVEDGEIGLSPFVDCLKVGKSVIIDSDNLYAVFKDSVLTLPFTEPMDNRFSHNRRLNRNHYWRLGDSIVWVEQIDTIARMYWYSDGISGHLCDIAASKTIDRREYELEGYKIFDQTIYYQLGSTRSAFYYAYDLTTDRHVPTRQDVHNLPIKINNYLYWRTLSDSIYVEGPDFAGNILDIGNTVGWPELLELKKKALVALDRDVYNISDPKSIFKIDTPTEVLTIEVADNYLVLKGFELNDTYLFDGDIFSRKLPLDDNYNFIYSVTEQIVGLEEQKVAGPACYDLFDFSINQIIRLPDEVNEELPVALYYKNSDTLAVTWSNDVGSNFDGTVRVYQVREVYSKWVLLDTYGSNSLTFDGLQSDFKVNQDEALLYAGTRITSVDEDLALTHLSSVIGNSIKTDIFLIDEVYYFLATDSISGIQLWRYPKRVLNSVPTETNLDNLKVYPNPTTDIVSIISDQQISKISIYNDTGVLLSSKAPTHSTTSLRELPQGMYYLEITTDSGVKSTIRIVKL